jgi:hypothetical protein
MMRKMSRGAKLLALMDLRSTGPRADLVGFCAELKVARVIAQQLGVDRQRPLEVPLVGENASHGSRREWLLE